MTSLINSAVCIVLALSTSMCLPSICRAQQLYEFVQNGTDDVLATFEILDLPVDELSDFGDLTFTAAGDAFFGFGEGVYPSEFDRSELSTSNSAETIIADGSGLRANSGRAISIFDDNSPVSNLPGFTLPSTFLMQFGGESNSTDVILLFQDIADAPRGAFPREGFGAWSAVIPEPSTIALITMYFCGSGFRRRR